MSIVRAGDIPAEEFHLVPIRGLRGLIERDRGPGPEPDLERFQARWKAAQAWLRRQETAALCSPGGFGSVQG